MDNSDSASYSCYGCTFRSNTARALSSHWQKFKECAEISISNSNNLQIATNVNTLQTDNNEDIISNSNTNDDEIDINDTTNTFDIDDFEPTYNPSFNNCFLNMDAKNVAAKVELLKILNTAKAPLYLFDHIITWAKNSVNQYDVDFGLENNTSRHKFVRELKQMYKLDKIEPSIQTVQLRGSGNTIELVSHSFKHSFYSLLKDSHLMEPQNLLFDEESIFDMNHVTPQQTIYNDIHTGTVYQMAKNCTLKNQMMSYVPSYFLLIKHIQI
jgi:hypothetical protein